MIPASLSDMYYYKVSNGVILIGLSISFLLRIEHQGPMGIWYWALGLLLPFFLCFILYLFRMIGASDIKLFSVIGSCYSLSFLLHVIVISFFVGGVFSLIQLIQKRYLLMRFLKLSDYISQTLKDKKIKPYYEPDRDEKDGIIPFAVMISIAFLLCLRMVQMKGGVINWNL